MGLPLVIIHVIFGFEINHPLLAFGVPPFFKIWTFLQILGSTVLHPMGPPWPAQGLTACAPAAHVFFKGGSQRCPTVEAEMPRILMETKSWENPPLQRLILMGNLRWT